MSLWVDKYRPRTLSQTHYHEDLARRLTILARTGDFPHLLVYGPSGAGKKTRIVGVLRELYGPGVEKLKMDQRIFMTTSNRKLELNIISSNYHLELTPSDVGNYDRVVISELLKDIAQTSQIDANAKQSFKVVVINEADALTREAQAALRRTMEKYSPNIRLILVASSTSKILAPIRSRTLLVRVAAPTRDDTVRVLRAVASQEGVAVSDALCGRIADESNRNLRRAVLMLETAYSKDPQMSDDLEIPPPDWEVYIDMVVGNMLREQSAQQILKIRGMLYDLLSHCIPATTILKTMMLKLLPRVDAALRPAIVHAAAFCEHRIRLGSKVIFHLEAFVARFMKTLAAYLMGIDSEFD